MKKTFFSRVILPISSIGWTVPTSLLMSMMLTRIVLSVIAARMASGSTRAFFIDVEVGHLEALALEALAAVEHGLVLGLASDDVVALLFVEVGHTLESEVVTLGRAGGEDDLLAAPGADELRDGAARFFDLLLDAPTKWMVALAALPKCSVKYGSMASTTRGSTGVVAWLSM